MLSPFRRPGFLLLGAISASLLSVGFAAPIARAGSFDALDSGAPIAIARADRSATDLERAVVRELNRLRQDPAGYAAWLETQREYFSTERGRFVLRLPGEQAIGLREGVAALDEAIATLSQLEGREPLELSAALSYGVQDWAIVMGTRGLRSGADHQGNDQGFYTRNYGQRRGNGFGIDSYQRLSAEAIVMAWAVGDGDPSRSIRNALLRPAFREIGVGCASHTSRELICSISVAEEFVASPEFTATDAASVAPREMPETSPSQNFDRRATSSLQAVRGANFAPIAPAAPTAPAPTNGDGLPPSERLSYNLENPPQSPEENARAIVAETNRMRANPAAYAEELVALLDRYDENGNIELPEIGFLYETQEGVAPVYEAIEVLRDTDPLPLLEPAIGLELAALDHVEDIGPLSLLGHIGSDETLPRERALRYGAFDSLHGENISYQYDPLNIAQWHLMMLIVDDGVPDRGHREALLRPGYQVTGVACGYHAGYQNICVMTYADGYTTDRDATARR